MLQACGTVVGRLGYKVKTESKKDFCTEHNLQSPSKLNVLRTEFKQLGLSLREATQWTSRQPKMPVCGQCPTQNDLWGYGTALLWVLMPSAEPYKHPNC